jgi:diaminohydroxyphosphoribosylaminopyrimidine deaminase/5-amino-6-(5-phosphoribosylamino)uracil reductase
MALALALGRRGLGRTWPNPAVGALVVRHDGAEPVIVGRGWTQAGGRPHAEVEALARAGAAAQGATLYVTLEPCSHYGKTPPCVDAVIAAGIARVVSAIEDPNPQVAGAGHRMLAKHGIAVEIGVGAAEARQMHAGHIRRIREDRPHVILKLAVSADGKSGLRGPNGPRPVAITGEAARERVHLMRAMSDAVLTGIGTVIADDPLLTCRLPGMADRSPVRLVLDSKLRLPLHSRLVASARTTPLWVVGETDVPLSDPAAMLAAENALRAHGAEILRVPAVKGRLYLPGVLKLLAGCGITRLLVEPGPSLAASFVRAGLVDEAVLLRSPMAVGPDGLDALEGIALDAFARACGLVPAERETVGVDTLERFVRE